MIYGLLINTFAIVTSILLLIFSLFLISQRKRRKLSSILLSVFLLSNSLYLFSSIIPAVQQWLKISPNRFSDIGFAFGFLFGPLLYLFTRSVTTIDYKVLSKEVWHFFLFVIYIITVISIINIPYHIIHIILNVQLFAYFILCIFFIRNYRIEIKNYFSRIDKINHTWLLYVVGAFFIMSFIDLVNFTLYEIGLNSDTLMNELTFLSIFINFIFAILIFYKALQQPMFLFGILKEMQVQKYKSSKLSVEEKDKYLKKIEDYFEREQPFLEPSLTIRDVSNVLKIPSKYISQIINESLHKNFYDFINTSRVEEAMNQLLMKKDKTILEILYDSGFNSKSAFNTAFKKQTGVTPTEFRRQNSTNK